MESFDVVVIGGGIAGLSTAWHLVQAGVTKTCVLEREWACGAHASGTNAAIYRQFEDDAVGVRLARRTRALLEVLSPDEPLLRQTGALYVATPGRLASAISQLTANDIEVRRLSGAEVAALASPVVLGARHAAALVPTDGVLDPHGMLQALQARLRAAGVAVRVSSGARPTRRNGHFVIATAAGELRAAHLVLAGGAWNAELGACLGAPAPLQPLRRHLALLDTSDAPAGGPVVWRLEDDEAYFRPESGGALASPCDETAWPAEAAVPMDSQALVSLGERLSTLAPALARATVRRAWGCLRTFAPDRQFIAGPDARVPGLHWCAGLGGRGMSCGLALGEVVALALVGRAAAPAEVSLARVLTPEHAAATP
ncbi:MAG: FAD-dependent oxidoreductase [Myxococcota bacterium]